MKKSPFLVTVLCMVFFFTSNAFSATYDLTGTWQYSTYNNWVTGLFCPPGYDTTGTCRITQSGDSFSFVFLTGTVCDPSFLCTFTGAVSGATYTCSVSGVVDNEGGVATNTMVFTVISNTEASGSGTSNYTHPNGFQCNWGQSITIAIDLGGIPLLVCDLDSDGKVDTNDTITKRSALIQEFQTWIQECWQPKNACGDYNSDGVVDMNDINEKRWALIQEFQTWIAQCFYNPMSSFKSFKDEMDQVLRNSVR